MARGQRMEGEAKQHILQILRAEGHGAKLEDHRLSIYPDCPFVGSSPDGVSAFDCSCCSGRRVLIEVKCPTKVENYFARNLFAPAAPLLHTDASVHGCDEDRHVYILCFCGGGHLAEDGIRSPTSNISVNA
ncbi:hypothetical protein HPB48_013334 [Haemaphysalis longicornis]|uniref:YqaJ viral recombinase domain-containing protein n=1 Tax=Haemaphysalis longicornis TaxID=44386 RepID=A0A9J6H5U2_HAELO|nr:hypothetical protein HPB48_013334 [Haemaphysalis longicornis]